MKLSIQNQTVNSIVKAGIGLIILGLSQYANAEIVHATFNWTGTGGYSTQGQFSFDNDAAFHNLVTENNGALKDLNWSAYKDGLQIYSETVVSNSVTESRNQFLDFNYDVSSNIITMIDTGAPSTWFTNRIDYTNVSYTSELQIRDLTLSVNEENVIVSLDNAVTAVPEPSTYMMMGLGLILIAGYNLRRQNQA
jgi:hypothetical protein